MPRPRRWWQIVPPTCHITGRCPSHRDSHCSRGGLIQPQKPCALHRFGNPFADSIACWIRVQRPIDQWTMVLFLPDFTWGRQEVMLIGQGARMDMVRLAFLSPVCLVVILGFSLQAPQMLSQQRSSRHFRFKRREDPPEDKEWTECVVGQGSGAGAAVQIPCELHQQQANLSIHLGP